MVFAKAFSTKMKPQKASKRIIRRGKKSEKSRECLVFSKKFCLLHTPTLNAQYGLTSETTETKTGKVLDL